MILLHLVLAVFATIGAALLLDSFSWFRRRPLSSRLAAYGPYGSDAIRSSRPEHRPDRMGATPAAVLLPLVDQVIGRITTFLGVHEDLDTRLARADMATTTFEFRSRQALHAVLGITAGAVMALFSSPGAATSILLCVGTGVLWVLLDEQSVARRIKARSHVLQLELPVIAEQLGVLIDAGTSLPAALGRIGQRGRGAAASDLHRVTLRIRQGSGEVDALSEWAERTDVVAVRRLVAVLALHRDATDLGRLISAEARAIRSETHRELVERIERRGQLVWIPVTVATLVPGLIFLAVPFMSALSQVTGT